MLVHLISCLSEELQALQEDSDEEARSKQARLREFRLAAAEVHYLAACWNPSRKGWFQLEFLATFYNAVGQRPLGRELAIKKAHEESKLSSLWPQSSSTPKPQESSSRRIVHDLKHQPLQPIF